MVAALLYFHIIQSLDVGYLWGRDVTLDKRTPFG
jgi:hypothetical protein